MRIAVSTFLTRRINQQIFVTVTIIATALFLQNLIFGKLEASSLALFQILAANIIVFNLFGLLILVALSQGKRFPLQGSALIKSLVIHLVFSIFLSTIHLILSQLVYHFLWPMPQESLPEKLVAIFQRWFYIEVLIYWLIIVVRGRSTLNKSNETRKAIFDKLSVKTEGQTRLIDLSDIYWLQAYDAYVKIYTRDKLYLKRCKISDLEKQLPPSLFQRIHRSAIVNLSKIKALEPYSNGEQFLILESDEKVKLSRSYKDKLPQLL